MINTHDRASVDATMKKSEYSYRDKEIICQERQRLKFRGWFPAICCKIVLDASDVKSLDLECARRIFARFQEI